MTIPLAFLTLMTACGGENGLEPIERTQTAVAQTQAALSIGLTQTALAAIQATQNAQVAATQTRKANPNPAVVRNADWTPVERDFDGVTMVLVPAGCFDMGSNNGQDDERPIHEICFDEPFWIDKFEVTNEQYGSAGCEEFSSEPDQPRNCVNWFEVSDFCEARQARLPTEAEWEYAARGPDSLVYPWGNEYDAALALGRNDPNYIGIGTTPVGSRPAGASWVGALDMSGNVWEWTSSLYEDYPYNPADGRERDTGGDSIDIRRVLRGGSFEGTARILRSAGRLWLHPNGGISHGIGFRCARSDL